MVEPLRRVDYYGEFEGGRGGRDARRGRGPRQVVQGHAKAIPLVVRLAAQINANERKQSDRSGGLSIHVARN